MCSDINMEKGHDSKARAPSFVFCPHIPRWLGTSQTFCLSVSWTFSLSLLCLLSSEHSQSCQHPALPHILSNSNCPHCSHHYQPFFSPKAIMFEKKIISSLVDFTFISLSFPFNGSFCYVTTFNLETSGQIKDLAFVKPLGIFM